MLCFDDRKDAIEVYFVEPLQVVSVFHELGQGRTGSDNLNRMLSMLEILPHRLLLRSIRLAMLVSGVNLGIRRAASVL